MLVSPWFLLKLGRFDDDNLSSSLNNPQLGTKISPWDRLDDTIPLTITLDLIFPPPSCLFSFIWKPIRFWGSLLVVVGEYDLTSDVENLKPIQKPVKRMIVHRNYNPLTFENDIALMELESPFDVQPHVVPICLPDPWEDFVGQVAHVAGWGKLSYGE